MPPKRPRPAPANFAALHHYSLTPLPTTTTTTTTTETPSTLTTEIQSLRRLIMDQELSISTLRQQLPSSSPPSAPSPTSTSTNTTSTTTPTDPKHHLRILRARKSAHDTAFATIDHLPPAASPLNLLLAYRSVLLVTSRTADSLVTVQSAITAASATLDREGMELAQQRAITGALTARLQREEAEGEGEGEGGGRGVAEMVKRRKEVGRRTAGALRELRGFVGGVLAGMLLAEEGGGGVVGDVVVEEVGGGEGEGEGEGEKKKGKKRGERRIDEMWGQKEEPGEEPDKSMAREFMEVLEALMNASLENDPYIPIKKDTAIVRFLIRAKAAAFHPKDARRLRLVDFGSSVEDG